jgi:uncharacterized protein YciI
MKKSILLVSCLLICIAAAAQNKSYTFIFLNNKPDKEVLSKEKADSIMQGHMNNIGRLAKEGKLLAAGPFEGGGGLFVFNTTSVKEANEWLATDPGVQAKRWNLEVLPYTVRNGSICPVGEKYEMVFYQFVRFSAKESLQKKTQHIDSFAQRQFKENHIIHAGMFSNESGIMILKADVAEETIQADPAVKEGLINYEMKKLYIAKGSFCEK